MELGRVAGAATSWPDAAIAIAGIALVGAVVVVIVWQALATWRARIEAGRTRGAGTPRRAATEQHEAQPSGDAVERTPR